MKTIIEMAREAGIYVPEHLQTIATCKTDLERFAELVTEQANARANTSWSLMCKKMVEFEREACAKVCDELHPGLATRVAAEHIRARGNT